MKSKMIKIISLCLCIAILASGAAYALASGKDKAENVKTAENITENTAEKQHEEAAAKSDTFKDETVYVLANPDGTVQKIIVSDWIKNTLSSEKITDVTELENTENIKGDESYTLGGNNRAQLKKNCRWIFRFLTNLTEKQYPQTSS